jgi:hypothetical protein
LVTDFCMTSTRRSQAYTAPTLKALLLSLSLSLYIYTERDLSLYVYIERESDLHKARTGVDSTNMPKWDAVIANFEMLDRCHAPSSSSSSSSGSSSSSTDSHKQHMLPWDHFRKALRLAGTYFHRCLRLRMHRIRIRMTRMRHAGVQELEAQHVQKLIEHFDSARTGSICWSDL